MKNNEALQEETQQEISVKDILNFVKEFYKKIIIAGLVGVVTTLIAAVVLAPYKATITLNNYSGLDIPRIKYLQLALPKLEQENQLIKKDENTKFLANDKLWEKAIKPNILVSKADGKQLLDSTALNAVGSKISSIEIIAKAISKESAVKRVEKISKFFIDGSSYIDLRDLIRGYELKTISIDSNLKKKISSAEVELAYLQKRIKNLNQLKGQYPATNTMLGQILDAKDSGAKYLPITTQIVAATTDANNLIESLARYRDEESQNIIYRQFVEWAKPLLDKNESDTNLGMKLLNISAEIEKGVSSNIQLIAIEEIKVSLSSIETNRVYGLKQVGVIDFENPSYVKYGGAGLLAGLFFGLLWAFGLKAMRQSRGE
jgi:hypothetical protein